MTVDIIIPVYNALACLQACVASVRACTAAGTFRLILVDDCSPDARVAPYLRSLQGDDDVLVLQNERNFGFVHSVNRGMQVSHNDVVLLNSDTEVTPHWLERLQACVCRDARTATATPFTNAGTICSVPVFLRDNPLPEGFTPVSYARLIERVSLREYPQIPTAVGFCMYIRRAAIDRVGLFDEKTFGRGYGEENDFCYRALRAGYRHVLCDDAFVYHKGSASFGMQEKNAAAACSLEILARRYPKEKFDTDRFCRLNPLRRLWRNIELFGAFANGRRTVLYILHMPLPYRRGDFQMGGTQKHVLELCKALDGRYNTLALWPEKDEGLCLIGNNGQTWKELYFRLDREQPRKHQVSQILGEILKAFSVDLVHVQHILGLFPAIFETVHRAGVPCVFTAHDYYMMCPQVNLLKNGVYCGGDAAQCADCPACAGIDIHEWRAKMARLLAQTQAVCVPDVSVARLLEGALPGVRAEVHPHGADLPARTASGAPANKGGDGRFAVAFVGNVARHKGSARAAEMIERGGPDIEWHVFGNVEDRSFHPRSSSLHLHGAYQGGQIIGLLQTWGIDLVCMLPVWPETFSYVLSECFAAGVPVLGSDLGALGTRIRASGGGWLLPPGATAGQALQKVDAIRLDHVDYQTKKDALTRFHPETVGEMADGYAALYERLFAAPRPHQGYDRELIVTALEAAANGTETVGLAYAERLERVRAVVRRLLPHRAADALLYGRYPFKKQLKRAAALFGDLLRRNGGGKG